MKDFETITFMANGCDISVKKQIEVVVPNYKELWSSSNKIEFNAKKLSSYLHNLNGPAVMNLSKHNFHDIDSYKSFFINGVLIGHNEEEFEKAKHEYLFSNKLQDIINE